MLLREKLEHSGLWLFRWRSYLPLLLLVLLPFALRDYALPLGSRALDVAWEALCLAVSCLGLLIRIHTIGHVPQGTSGRNQRQQVADTLNTTGLYSIVRNPLYLGNFLIYLGLAMVPRCWWMPVLVTSVFALYWERIIYAEEQFLERKFGEAYTRWAARTPAILADVRLWQPPALPFSWRTAVRREYLGVCGFFVVFSLVEVGEHVALNGRIAIEGAWPWIGAGAVAVFLVIRFFRKQTRLLEEVGR